MNYSGGTEISGGILMGNPLLPIKPCSFPLRARVLTPTWLMMQDIRSRPALWASW